MPAVESAANIKVDNKIGCKKVEHVEVIKTTSVLGTEGYRTDLQNRCCIEERFWDHDGKLLFWRREVITLEELDDRGLYEGYLG
jgi:hypothetical protein